ncbi:hypothetical protein GOP47_0002077 [Adiantum capillus-veneris]|uniref:ABC1 atypical kinase-like domain-containing protein n=1 Tax=Adiantum capillus-veneris TaxID=13818 RepID=A0A9D4V9P0_ADICA|nr:hypothetical protein GOP47_0002077 [Adiantum capillus-veneris]
MDFEEKPVASGSIAQVYKATLQDGVAFGRQKGTMTVAIKVRHPGVTDVIWEAAHLSRFSYNFRSWRDVSFPRPVYLLVHPGVLVESFEQGESVSNYIELSDNNQVSRKLAYIGTNTIMKMLLVDNFIHVDMHPDNILKAGSASLILISIRCTLQKLLLKQNMAESLAYTINAVMAP